MVLFDTLRLLIFGFSQNPKKMDFFKKLMQVLRSDLETILVTMMARLIFEKNPPPMFISYPTLINIEGQVLPLCLFHTLRLFDRLEYY